jgi:CRISPR-associated protein Csc2
MTYLNETFDKLDKYFEKEIPLLRSPKTIQILVMRQTHDYSIFRTEETRELNAVALPKSISDPSMEDKVVFLASKQKAPESRLYISYGREYASKYDIKLTDELQNCELKDELCRKCPRCVLFGSMITESSSSKPKRKRWSIKHRIEYSSAFSLEAYDSISERITFNALVDSTQSTGRALGTVENIIPLANFPTVITLSSITEEEFIFLLKVLLASKSYGAEGRLKGDCENYIVGICAGLEEIITSLEYNLELAAMSDDNLSNIVNVTEQILNDYLKKSAFKTNNLVLASNDLQSLVDSVSTYEPNKEFVQALYNNANKFAEEVDKRA